MKLRRTPIAQPFLLFLAPSLQLVLILIFFLLLSSTFLLQPGVAVTLPKSPFMLSPQRNPRIVTVTAPPLSAIFFENSEVTESELRRLLQDSRGRAQTIIIKADQRAFYEKISAVMSIALDLGIPVVLATAEEGTAP